MHKNTPPTPDESAVSLSEVERAVLNAMIEIETRTGRAAAIRELAAVVGRAHSPVHATLQRLARKGAVWKNTNARGCYEVHGRAFVYLDTAISEIDRCVPKAYHPHVKERMRAAAGRLKGPSQ